MARLRYRPNTFLVFENVTLDRSGQTASVTVRNLTETTVTAYSLKLKVTFADGSSEERGQLWDIILVLGTDKATDEKTTGEVLYPEASRTSTTSTIMSHPERTIDSVSARPIMAVFENGSAVGDRGEMEAVRQYRAGTFSDLIEVLSRVRTVSGKPAELPGIEKALSDVTRYEGTRGRGMIERPLRGVHDLIASGHGDRVPTYLNAIRAQYQVLSSNLDVRDLSTKETR